MGPDGVLFSLEIFEIASATGFSLRVGEIRPIEDSQLVEFRSRYKDFYDRRKISLEREFSSGAGFNGSVPTGINSYVTAINSIWYYDRIVVEDPIYDILSDVNPENIESRKWMLSKTLQWLGQFRTLIEAGYLLLGGGLIRKPSRTVLEELYNKFSGDMEIIRRIQSGIQVEAKKIVGETGNSRKVFRLTTENNISFSTHDFEGAAGRATFNIFDESFDSVSLESFISEAGKKSELPIRQCIESEIYRYVTIISEAARSAYSPVFSNYGELEIVRSMCGNGGRVSPIVPSKVPVLADTHANDFVEVRERLPQAFVDFRGHLSERIYGKSASEAQTTLNAIIEDWGPKLRKELDRSRRRSRVKGYTKMAISGAICITTAASGSPFPALLQYLLTALQGAEDVAASVEQLRRIEQENKWGLFLNIPGSAGKSNSARLRYSKPARIGLHAVMRDL